MLQRFGKVDPFGRVQRALLPYEFLFQLGTSAFLMSAFASSGPSVLIPKLTGFADS
jgi:hypothetical protein